MNTIKKKFYLAASLLSLMFLFLTGSVLAHVVVKPGEALTGAFLTFTMGVPNEKDNPTTSVKLVIPEGLQHVTPTVKPGWTIATEKIGEGEEAKVKSITWSGGLIPTGQRDDFTFSAKTSDTAADLQWKAYQTYENGVTVAWDQDPAGAKDHTGNPFSVTKVTAKPTESPNVSTTKSSDDTSGKLFGIAALAVSFIALAASTRKPATAAKKK